MKLNWNKTYWNNRISTNGLEKKNLSKIYVYKILIDGKECNKNFTSKFAAQKAANTIHLKYKKPTSIKTIIASSK